MKYWRGYLTAAIFAAFSWVLIQMGQRYTTLVDMIYPYVTRSLQTVLTGWTGGFDFLVWQTAIIFLVIAVIASLVLLFIFRGKVVRWLGWALAVVSIIFFLHTGLYGLNVYSGPIEDDLRMDMVDYTQSELEEATIFYRDKANALLSSVNRDAEGNVVFSDFDTLASQTGDGYRLLSRERSYSIFGGDYTPVKELGWSWIFSGMGKTGVTCALTGEAAVNPDLPDQGLPFAMAKEMAHRLCVAREEDADFAAFLNCQENPSTEYQYSGYFMAYRFCISALESVDAAAAQAIASGADERLLADLEGYKKYFDDTYDETTTRLVDTVTDTYLLATGEEKAVSYGSVCDYLVNWYIDQYAEPEEIVVKFDPLDETQVDLSGLVNAKQQEDDGE